MTLEERRDLDRLMARHEPGDRVRAVCDIIYGDGGEVAAGTVGVVEPSPYRTGGLSVVRWPELGAKPTGNGSLEKAEP